MTYIRKFLLFIITAGVFLSVNATTINLVNNATNTSPYSIEPRGDYGVSIRKCRGALIAPSWVLTAKHCIGDKKQNNIKKYGKVTFFKQGENGNIQKIKYNSKAVFLHDTKDIALMQLKSPVDNDSFEPALLLATPLLKEHGDFKMKQVVTPEIWHDIPVSAGKIENAYVDKDDRQGKGGASGSPWVFASEIFGDVIFGITHGAGRAPQTAYIKDWLDQTINAAEPGAQLHWVNFESIFPQSSSKAPLARIEYQPKLNLHDDFVPLLQQLAIKSVNENKAKAYQTSDRYLNKPELFDTNSGVFLDAKIEGLYECRNDIKFEEIAVFKIISQLSSAYYLETEDGQNLYTDVQLLQLKNMIVYGFKNLVDNPPNCDLPKVRWGKSTRFGNELALPLYLGLVDQQYGPYKQWAIRHVNGWNQSNGGGANGLDGVSSNIYSLIAHAGIAENGAGKVYRRDKLVDAYKLIMSEALRAYQFMAQRSTLNGVKPLELSNIQPGIRADYTYFSHGRVNMSHSYGRSLRSQSAVVLRTLAAFDFEGIDYPYTNADFNRLSERRITALKTLKNFFILSQESRFGDFYGSYTLKGRGQTRARKHTPTLMPKALKPLPNVDPTLVFIEAQLSEKLNIEPMTDEQLLAQINGVKDFPDGDHLVNRSNDYAITIYAASRYTKTTEQHGRSNKKSTMIGRGSYSLEVYGDEYKNIQPIWNWNVLPGVTGIWNGSAGNGSKGKTPNGDNFFTGGLENVQDDMGIVALHMNYAPRGHAKKAYFTYDNKMICLGADIYSKKKRADMATSINQSLLIGDVSYSADNKEAKLLSQDKKVIDGGFDWAYHAGIGYRLLGDSSVIELTNKEKSGNWADVSSESVAAANIKGPNKADVFGLYIHHNRASESSPSSYAYLVDMDTNIDKVANIDNNDFIITNTASVQAVRVKSKDMISIIFWEAGEYIDPELGDALRVKVNEPGLVMITNYNSDNAKLHYSDPSEAFVKNDTREINVTLPTSNSGYQAITLHGPSYQDKSFLDKRTLTITQDL